MSVSEDLQAIGFDIDEADTYELLVTFGFRTAGQIEAYLHKGFGKVVEILEKLELNGFVKKLQTKTREANIYIPVAPQIALSADVSTKLQNNLSTLNLRVIQQWQATEFTIDGNVTKLQDEIKAHANQLTQIIKAQVAEREAQLNNFKTRETAATNTATKVIQENIKQFMVTPLNQVVENIRTKQRALQTFQSETQENLTNAEAMQMQVLETSTSKFNADVNQFLDKATLNLTEKMEQAKLNVLELKNKKQTELGLTTKALHEQLEAETQKQIEAIDKAHKEHLNSCNEVANMSGEKLKVEITKAGAELIEVQKATKKHLDETGKKTQKATIDVFLKFQKGLNQNAEELQKQMVNTGKTMQQGAVEVLSKILDKTSADLDGAKQTLDKTIQDGQTTLTEELERLNDTLLEDLSKKFTKVKNKTTEFSNNLSSSTTSSVKQLNTRTTALVKFIANFLASTHSDLNRKLTNLEKSISKKFLTVTKQLTSSTDKFQLQRQNDINSLQKLEKESTHKFIKDLKSAFDLQKKNFEASFLKSKTKFITKLANEIIKFEEVSNSLHETQHEQLVEIGQKTETVQADVKRVLKEFTEELENKGLELKTNTFTEFTRKIEDAYLEAQTEVHELQEKSGKRIEEFGESFRNGISGLADSIPEKIEELFANHNEKLQNFERQFSTFKIRIDEYLASLVDYLEKNPKAAAKNKKMREPKINEIRLLYSDFTRLVNDIEPFIQTETESSQSYREEVVTQLSRTVQYEVQTVRDILVNTGDNFAELINDIDANTNESRMEFVAKFSTNMESIVETVIDNIKQVLSEKLQKQLRVIFEQIQKGVLKQKGKSGKYAILEQQKALDKKLIATFKLYRDEVEHSFNAVTKEVTGFFTSEGLKSTEILQSFEDELQSNLEADKTNVKTFVNQITGEIKKLTKSTTKTILTSVKESEQGIKTVTTEKAKEIKTRVTSDLKKFKGETNANLTEIAKNSEKFKKELIKMEKETEKELNGTISNAKTLLETNINAMLESLETTTNEAKLAFNSSKSTLEEQVEVPLENAIKNLKLFLETFSKKSSTTKEEIAGLLEHMNTVATQNFETLSNLQNSRQKATEQSGKEMEMATKNFVVDNSNLMEKFSGAHKASIKQQNQDLNQLFSSKLEELSQQFDKLAEIHAKMLENLQMNTQLLAKDRKAEGENLLADFNTKQQTTVLEAANPLLNFFKHDFSLILENLESLIQKIQQNQLEMNTKIDSTFQKNAVELSGRFAEILTSYLNQVKSEAEAELEKLLPKVTKFTEQVFQLSQAGKLEVQESFNEIPNIISETLDAAGRSIKLLTEIAKGVMTRPVKPIEDTYIEASEEAIKAGLNGLLKRTKSKIDIISPQLFWIDPSEFETFSRKTITIVTDPTQHTAEDKAIIEKIRDSGTPLVLRRFDRSRLRSRIDLNVILVARDNEEIMIAEPFGSPNIYGIVSQNEKFVTHLSTMLTNFQSMPKMA